MGLTTLCCAAWTLSCTVRCSGAAHDGRCIRGRKRTCDHIFHRSHPIQPLSLHRCQRPAVGNTCHRPAPMRLVRALLLICCASVALSKHHEHHRHHEVSFLAEKSLASEDCDSRHKSTADLLLTPARIRVRDGESRGRSVPEMGCWHFASSSRRQAGEVCCLQADNRNACIAHALPRCSWLQQAS